MSTPVGKSRPPQLILGASPIVDLTLTETSMETNTQVLKINHYKHYHTCNIFCVLLIY
jgi:hypothetical protein